MTLLRLVLVCSFFFLPATVVAQAAQPVNSPKVEELLQLLGDKDVQNWLQSHKTEAVKAAPTAARVEPGAVLSSRLREIRQHMQGLIQAIPQFPSEIGRAAIRLRSATEGYRFTTIVFLAGSFILLGLVAEWLFRRMVQRISVLAQRPGATTPRERLNALLLRLTLGIGSIAVFAAGSFGGFLLFQWPNLLRTIVVTLLMAALAFMIVRCLLAILFGPSDAASAGEGGDRRLLPMSHDAARYYRTRLALAFGWFAFGYAFVQVLRSVEMSMGAIELVAYVLGLGLLIIGLEAVWRGPIEQPMDAETDAMPAAGTGARGWLFGVAFIALWLLWVAGTMRVFWLIAVAMALPLAITWSGKAVRHLFRTEPAPGGEALKPCLVGEPAPEGEASESDLVAEPASEDEAPASGLVCVAIERTLRAALILASIWLLAWAWGVGLHSLAGDTLLIKMARSLLTVLIILLVADLAWQLTKTLIDAFLLKAADTAEPGSREAVRHAKMRTLLPIIRNVAMIFFATLAVLMALSAMGVEIAPLIASAGVVGVAIGFGAQTLVKDVISGMFYLMDDAFRVGEYIITGKYVGTVESFSLRSVRLRHHNGPIYTIPFGELGAVQNMSRDYVIDKFKLTVTYDSDLEKARKLIKKIGLELMEDPELAGSLIEPMKMQRVDQFGDYGIVLKCKMTTKPGAQFEVRKKAFPLIKKLFDENGIEFAFPTVKVAESDGDRKAAVAQQALTLAATESAGTNSS